MHRPARSGPGLCRGSHRGRRSCSRRVEPHARRDGRDAARAAAGCPRPRRRSRPVTRRAGGESRRDGLRRRPCGGWLAPAPIRWPARGPGAERRRSARRSSRGPAPARALWSRDRRSPRPRRSTWGRGRAGRRRHPACHQISSPDRDRCGTRRSRAWASPGTSRPDRRPPPGSRRPPAGGRRARRARDGSGTRSAGSVPPPRRCRRSHRRPRRRGPARCRRSAEPDRAGHGRPDGRGHSGRRARLHRRRGPCVPAPLPAASCRCPRAPAPTRNRLARRPRPPRRPRATPDRPRGRRRRDPPP